MSSLTAVATCITAATVAAATAGVTLFGVLIATGFPRQGLSR